LQQESGRVCRQLSLDLEQPAHRDDDWDVGYWEEFSSSM
jgi:hypothetical protein